MKIRKAVITAAGWGTRFLPATKAHPKEMLPLLDKPPTQYVAEEVVASGIEHLVIVTAAGKRAIEDHLAIVGRYVLAPEAFSALEITPPGRNQEIQLTDGLKILLQQQEILGWEFERARYDAGEPLGLLKAAIALALNRSDMDGKLRDYLQQMLFSVFCAREESLGGVRQVNRLWWGWGFFESLH